MNKFEVCVKIVEGYLKNNKEEPTIPININDQINFLMAKAYVEGYNAGKADVVELLTSKFDVIGLVGKSGDNKNE